MEERLQKLLAQAGIASRRKAETWILDGKVRVNGRVAKLGDKADPARDKILVDGRPLEVHTAMRYLMLHKPRGFVTTMADERGRKCVAELVAEVPERVYPVGRLDRESEGLLLLTNDGAFANAMMHPSHHVPKTYRVTIHPGITEDQLTQFAIGIPLDGRKTAPAGVRVLKQEPGRVVLEIVLQEGRNRQIRRMCEALGLEVARLKRIAIGRCAWGCSSPGLAGSHRRRGARPQGSRCAGQIVQGAPAADHRRLFKFKRDGRKSGMVCDPLGERVVFLVVLHGNREFILAKSSVVLYNSL